MSDPWEIRYQTGNTPWEKGTPCPGLIDYLKSHPPIAGKILVPGCGWGHDVRALSGDHNEVIGLDIAPSAISGARSFPVIGNERYHLGNLFELPPEFHQAFDWVWEHTCFCAIDPSMREDYVKSVSAALKSGGHLLAIFYLNPDHDEGPPFGVTQAELDTRFDSEFELLEKWNPTAAYPGREDREQMRLLRKK